MATGPRFQVARLVVALVVAAIFLVVTLVVAAILLVITLVVAAILLLVIATATAATAWAWAWHLRISVSVNHDRHSPTLRPALTPLWGEGILELAMGSAEARHQHFGRTARHSSPAADDVSILTFALTLTCPLASSIAHQR